MSNVGGITSPNGVNGSNPQTPTGPLTAANALTWLKAHANTSISISDTVQNILKYLHSLSGFASKITSLATTDANKNMNVAVAQYQTDNAVIAKWGATSGQTVGITAAKANFTATPPSYVTSVSVADSSASIASNLDNLQSLATSGLLQGITQTGTAQPLSITSAQLVADQTALGKIENQAYTLAIRNASVSDVLGLGGNAALSTNGKVKSIAIVDTTDAINSHLDALQQVGLRIKSITQTDPGTDMTVTGTQYHNDWATLGKIVTSDYLDVLDASAAQATTLASDHRIVTADVQDTAKNVTKNWALLQSLTDSLTSVTVTDQGSDIQITADQLANSSTLLSKFTDTADSSYRLAVTNVSAGTASAVANTHNVDHVDVVDTGANLVANMDDLQTINGSGLLRNVTLADPRTPLSIDASYLQGNQLTATQAVLNKIKGNNYTLATTNASTASLATLASNKRVVSIAVSDTSSNIQSSLDSLYRYGSWVKSIEQTDSGATFTLSQAQMDSRSTVLAKINGGYTVDVTGVTATKAAADLKNLHVGDIAISDTGRNIAAAWTTLRGLGTSLTSITTSDNTALNLSASDYQLGVHDNLTSKFDGSQTFSISNASLDQAQALSSDQAVTQIDVSATGSDIADNIAAYETLASGGSIHSISNQTPSVSLSLDASQLQDAQAVLSLIKGGSYTLDVGGVAAGDAKTLAATNHKIVGMEVTGDSTSIVANLSDLNALGKKLTTITQTDAPGSTLEMTEAAFDQNANALTKIEGGYLADLTDVAASKAATYANNATVSSIQVSDSGADLSTAWGTLAQLGSKLTGVTQSDNTTLQVNANDWLQSQDLQSKFTTDLTASVSGASVAQVDTLAADNTVQAIQVQDSSDAVAGGMADLATQDKLNLVVLNDPTAAMNMSGAAYVAGAPVLALVKNGQYKVNLSDVSADDGATLASDTHVSSMDVVDTSANVSSNFSDLSAATNLNSITLSDPNGTLTLTSAQILGGLDTLANVTGSYDLAATDVATADLSGIKDIPQLASVGISDTADNVSSNFGDILALGDSLTQIHLSDNSPVLSLSEQNWTAGTDALATIDSNYQVDVTDTVAGDAQTVAGSSNVRNVAVADTASNIASNWDTLVGLYNNGDGQLSGLSLTDTNNLTLTADQQTAGDSMISALLPDQTILTA